MKEQIRPGLLLRVISSHGLGAPVGSLATVKAVETSLSGDWMCIVEYHDRKQPRQGPRLYRSHLWISDLGRFEVVTNLASSNRHVTVAGAVISTQLQLRLPFDDGG